MVSQKQLIVSEDLWIQFIDKLEDLNVYVDEFNNQSHNGTDADEYSTEFWSSADVEFDLGDHKMLTTLQDLCTKLFPINLGYRWEFEDISEDIYEHEDLELLVCYNITVRRFETL